MGERIELTLTRAEAESLLPKTERTLMWSGSFGWIDHQLLALDKLRSALTEEAEDRA